MVKTLPRPVVQKNHSEDLLALKQNHVAKGVHATHPIFIRAAQNSVLQDVDGKTYIDFTSGIGATNMGHNNPFVVDAIKKQTEHYLHTCFTASHYEPYVRVCEALNKIIPGHHLKKTALFTTGAEAVENAIKISKVHTGRTAVVSFEHGFHGRTLMTLSLTAKIKPYKQGFGPFAPEVYKLPYPYLYRRPRGISEQR